MLLRVALGEGVVIHQPDLVNLYDCRVGEGTRIGAFVEIQKNAVVGRNCKVSSHSFICEGVTLEDGVFIGHGVMFTNDVYPRATTAGGALQTASDWTVLRTLVRQNASIGSNATILPGITIGESAAASPENFDKEIGRKIARENARNKIWALEGYLLRSKLAA